MVNLGNTLFSLSQQMRMQELARQREEDTRAVEQSLQTQQQIEDARDRDFDRQMRMAELKGKFAEVAGEPAPVSRNQRIQEALGLGGMAGRAEQAKEGAAQRRDLSRLGIQQGFQSREAERRRKHDVSMEDLRAQYRQDAEDRRRTLEGALGTTASGVARGKVYRDVMNAQRGRVSDWMKTAAKKMGIEFQMGPKGQLFIMKQPEDPKAQAMVQKIDVVNHILVGVTDSEQVDHLAALISQGAGAQELNEWWMRGGAQGLSPAETGFQGGPGLLADAPMEPGGFRQDLADELRRDYTPEEGDPNISTKPTMGPR